ncbi:MAG: DUF3137 domain-containing protein [Acidobacteria bacterium]|nr:DUF3137 domain-containing protein [Acidobacteriota bacterium]
MAASPAPTVPDLDALERRRRLTLRFAAGALVTALVAIPTGMAIGEMPRSETTDTFAGVCLLAGPVGLIAAAWIVRAWQAFMRRHMVAAAVAHRTDIRHIDSELDLRGTEAVLSSDAFALGAFRDSGLAEAFESASVQHVLTGDAAGVPFAVAELTLHDGKQYRMFGGVLASFRLARPRPGLTVVTRDRGLLGNLLARTGGAVEPIALEDPEFEGVFEVYGDDQVGGRVILTTTMLQRLKALDDLGHARGFACAFRGHHLLVAFDGMDWRCPAWRILVPLDAWLAGYGAWLTGLVDLPLDIVQTLNLVAPPPHRPPAVAVAPEPVAAVAIHAGTPEVFSSSLARLVGEGGMAAVYIMSGTVFGGLAVVAAKYGWTEGFPASAFWYWWGMTGLGLAYGGYAASIGLRQLAQLAWKWKSPLRTMKRRR